MREREVTEKQWTEIETEIKTIDNDMTKTNGEEKSSITTTPSVEESLPKVNPVKWTVMRYFYEIFIFKKISKYLQRERNCENLRMFHVGG